MNTNLQIPTALQPSTLQDQRSGNTSAQASGLGPLPPHKPKGLKARNNFAGAEGFEFPPHCGANCGTRNLERGMKFEMTNHPTKTLVKLMNKLGQEVLKDIADLEGMLK